MPRGEARPPPRHPQALSKFYSLDSGDFRRHFVIDPARILCVAGCFRCIGDPSPVHVFPATFLVALASVFTSSVCHPLYRLDIPARCLCWGSAAARFRRAPVGRNADKGEKWRGIEGQRENNWMLADVFNLMPRKTSDGVLRIEI